MPLLPDRDSRARAADVQAFEYNSYEADGWRYKEWRLKASRVTGTASLEGWYPPTEAGEPVVGRIRIKHCEAGSNVDRGAIAGLLAHAEVTPGLTEILNLELEPGFIGQGLGVSLMRTALHDLAANDLVFCEPRARDFSNIAAEASATAADSFYRRVGLVPDDRSPGLLVARRSDLLLGSVLPDPAD